MLVVDDNPGSGCARGATSTDELTPREKAVLGLMAEGRTNRAIADHLMVSERAVERHVTAIFTKLDLSASEGTTGACSPCWPS